MHFVKHLACGEQPWPAPAIALARGELGLPAMETRGEVDLPDMAAAEPGLEKEGTER
jgi:hypothetical protein